MSQELDDVYQDVCGVVAETLVQGADIMTIKVRNGPNVGEMWRKLMSLQQSFLAYSIDVTRVARKTLRDPCVFHRFVAQQ